jgi:hypothetical protein
MLNINSNQVTHLLDQKGLEERKDHVYPICSPDRRSLQRIVGIRYPTSRDTNNTITNNETTSGPRYGWGNNNTENIEKYLEEKEALGEEENKIAEHDAVLGHFATIGNFDSSNFQIPISVMSELSRNNQYTSPIRDAQHQSRNSNNSDYQLKSPQIINSNTNDENNYTGILPESHPQTSPSPRRRVSPNRQMNQQNQPTSPWRRRRTHDNFGRRDPFADGNNNTINRGSRRNNFDRDGDENYNSTSGRGHQYNNENNDSRFEDEIDHLNTNDTHNSNSNRRNNSQHNHENARSLQQQHRNRPSLQQRLRPWGT